MTCVLLGVCGPLISCWEEGLRISRKIRWELSIAGHITCLQLLQLHGSAVLITEHSTLRGELQLKLRQMPYSRPEKADRPVIVLLGPSFLWCPKPAGGIAALGKPVI